jgi:hypothetical protein
MIRRPDEYGHNNPDYAIADSDSVRGGGRVVADLAALYALSSKTDQLKVRVTRVWVTAEGKYYVLKDIANVGNSNGWEIEVTGGGSTIIYSTDIEADKLSTTKVSAIKTLYDWAVGKFQSVLVSGTINSTSILGSGDIVIDAGSVDYDDLTDKPQINSVELSGNKTTTDLNLDIYTGATAPANPTERVQWLDTTSGIKYEYVLDTWVELGPQSTAVQGGGLTAVNTDSSLTGVGTVESPLSVAHNTTTGIQGGAVGDYQHLTSAEKASYAPKDSPMFSGYIYTNTASATADTVNDRREIVISGVKRFERCTVANVTKGGGTWALEMTIYQDGKVNIGGLSGFGKLNVGGLARCDDLEIFKSNNSPALRFLNAGTAYASGILVNGAALEVLQFDIKNTNGFFGWYTNNAVNLLMKLNSSSGNLLVNTTTDNNTDKLQVNGSASNTTGVWATLSDERLKTEIAEIDNPIDKVLRIANATRQFRFIDEEKYAKGQRTGYIAQLLRENGLSGHVTERDPQDEVEGALFGWEYGDSIEKVYYTDTDKNDILDENGEPAYSEKITRVPTVVGEKVLGIENNFAPYLFPAIAVLVQENNDLKARLTAIEKHLGLC